MVSPFETFFALAKTYGIFEFYLPFLLVFTLFFGLLQKIKIFGEQSKNINIIIALVAALYVMVYSPAAITITQFFSTFFTQTSIVLVTLLVGIMIVGLVASPILQGKKWEEFGKRALGGVVLIAVLIGVSIFYLSGGPQLFSQIIPGLNISGDDLILLVLLAITVIAVWYMTKGGGEGKE